MLTRCVAVVALASILAAAILGPAAAEIPKKVNY